MELEEAIKRLSMKAITSSADAPDYPNCIVMKKDLTTVLNHLTKQDKMIDKMISMLEDYGADEFICNEASKILYKNNEICNGNCKECINKYFENKANEEAE